MLGFNPLQTELYSFIQNQTVVDIQTLSPSTNTVIIIDELQILYPNTAEKFEAVYKPKELLAPQKYGVAQIQSFWALLKRMPQMKISVICFAGFGSYKSGSLIGTPDENFDIKTPEFMYFLPSELDELYLDFTQRSQWKITSEWDNKFPEDLRYNIQYLTNGHVGYVSFILHTINEYCHRLKNVKQAIEFLYSSTMLQRIQSTRPTPDWKDLNDTQKELLKLLWMNEILDVEKNPEADTLVRRGWVSWDKQGKIVLPCRLSKQIMVMGINANIQRPLNDSFKKLEDFVQFFFGNPSE